MPRYARRLSLAALISILCLIATNVWFLSLGKRTLTHHSRQPIAQLNRTSDHVLRKPTDRLIWEEIQLNEELYQGEAVRTSSRSDAEILFLESQLLVELEPNSVIVIEQRDGKTNLGLLEGSLFAKSTEASAGASSADVVLTAGSSRVNLNGAEVSVGRSGKDIDVQVVKGTAVVQNAGKSVTLEKGKGGLLQGDQIRTTETVSILSPNLNGPVYIRPDSSEGLVITYQPLTGVYEYELWGGRTRATMTRVAGQKQIAANRISMSVPTGRWIWQLVAKSKADGSVVKSALSRSQVISLLPPQILYPQTKQVLKLTAQNPVAELQWLNPGQLEDLRVEVFKMRADNDQPERKIASLDSDGETLLAQAFQTPGRYSMRVSGRLSGSREILNSPTHTFDVEFVSTPTDTNAGPGTGAAYETLGWADGQSEVTWEYVTNGPELEATWPVTPTAQSWRVYLSQKEDDPADVKPLLLNEPHLKQAVPHDGDYQVVVEALGANQKVLARSGTRRVHVQMKPLLPAPQFAEAEMKADGEGRARLLWRPIEGAKGYAVRVSKEGNEIQRVKTENPTVDVEDLNPGLYQVQVQSLDGFGRAGSFGEPRDLSVPDQSAVRAPTFKKIKVK